MQNAPTVSVITPCLNAARYIAEAIQSVFAQDYPHIEYLVMDGGSSDGTLDVLRSYQPQLTYESNPDRSAADAINRGFARARGEILAWLNADDTYLPGAVSKAVAALAANSDAAAVYGEGYWTDSGGKILGRYPTAPYDPALFAHECFICQPACFVRRRNLEDVGMLNSSLRASFDYDLWIRLAKRYRFVHVPEYLATSRMHRENKTLGQRGVVFAESIDLLIQHYGYVPVNWIYAYLSFLRDRRDQFFEPLRPSAATYLLTLPAGMRHNYRHPFRYFAEWLALLRRADVHRYWPWRRG